MKKPCVLISGPTAFRDEELVGKLKKNAIVLRNGRNHGVEAIAAKRKIDLLLLEFPHEEPAEIEIIKNLKNRFPALEIILIDGDRELMAKAFAYGVRDVFRKPYKGDLIVERVHALLIRRLEANSP